MTDQREPSELLTPDQALAVGLFLEDFMPAGDAYDVDVSESPSAAYVYLAPEVRLARRFPSRLELSVGVAVLAMVSVDQPSWTDRQPVIAAPKGQQGDGVATFGTQTIAGGFLLSVVPSLGARYAF